MRRFRHCNRLPAQPSFIAARPAIPAFIATSLIKPRAAMNDAAATRQMAEDMRAAESRDGGISADELEALGFTRAQVKTLAAAARQRAQALAEATL
jgi:hypothetical protein